MYSSTISLTSALNVVGGQRHAPAVSPTGGRTVIDCTGGCAGCRTGLDGGLYARTVRTAASRRTD